MDEHIRNAIMRSAESFIAEYDPNENRRIDNNTAKALVAKLKIINRRKECPICFDNANSNKISILPCCGNEICQPCIIGTITRNTKDCPMCRSDLVDGIQEMRPQPQHQPQPQQPQHQPQHQHNLQSTKVSKNIQIVKKTQQFTFIKYNNLSGRTNANGKAIKTRKYLIEPVDNSEEREPLHMVYHNNSISNRQLFESDVLGHYLDNANSLRDEPETWDNIRKQCRNFTNRNKEVEPEIPDNIVRPFYRKLKNTISSQIA
jgi:hypothetical protein